jgi:hypothetical protein
MRAPENPGAHGARFPKPAPVTTAPRAGRVLFAELGKALELLFVRDSGSENSAHRCAAGDDVTVFHPFVLSVA